MGSSAGARPRDSFIQSRVSPVYPFMMHFSSFLFSFCCCSSWLDKLVAVVPYRCYSIEDEEEIDNVE